MMKLAIHGFASAHYWTLSKSNKGGRGRISPIDSLRMKRHRGTDCEVITRRKENNHSQAYDDRPTHERILSLPYIMSCVCISAGRNGNNKGCIRAVSSLHFAARQPRSAYLGLLGILHAFPPYHESCSVPKREASA